MKKQDTYVNQVLRAAEQKRRNDKACKMVLKSRQVLAFILKEIIPEYQECSAKEIAERYIEPEEASLNTAVGAVAAALETVEGSDRECDEAGEATVYYDVRFRALLPDRSRAQIYLYFDIEAQNSYYPGYPLEKRVEYYLARMLSAQLTVVSKDTNYDILQKVYSIWICTGMDIPKKQKQTISSYFMQKKDVYGQAEIPKENYDLMTAYVIRLGEGETEERLIGMLQTLFTEKLPATERLNRLEKMYGIAKTREFKEEVARMCSYSDYIEARGMEQGMEQGMEKGIAQGMEKGMAQGIEKAKLEIALKMLRAGKTQEEVMEFTDLSREEIGKLENEL